MTMVKTAKQFFAQFMNLGIYESLKVFSLQPLWCADSELPWSLVSYSSWGPQSVGHYWVSTVCAHHTHTHTHPLPNYHCAWNQISAKFQSRLSLLSVVSFSFVNIFLSLHTSQVFNLLYLNFSWLSEQNENATPKCQISHRILSSHFSQEHLSFSKKQLNPPQTEFTWLPMFVSLAQSRRWIVMMTKGWSESRDKTLKFERRLSLLPPN